MPATLALVFLWPGGAGPADVLHRVSLRIVTMPIQSQGVITRDNASVDISAVVYFRVVDAVKSVIAIENVRAALGLGIRHHDPTRTVW